MNVLDYCSIGLVRWAEARTILSEFGSQLEGVAVLSLRLVLDGLRLSPLVAIVHHIDLLLLGIGS